jgi:uncharacterized protein
VKLIRLSGLAVTPWKNGGGTTTEIAVFPPDTDFGTFEWRLSMANVASDGPFSQFPGIDRTLTVIEGKGLRLVVDGAPPIDLTPRSAPLAFAGDVPTTASLIDGPIRDLNVMTRRGRWMHAVSRILAGEAIAPAPLTLIVSLGEAVIAQRDVRAQLAFGDVARLEGSGADLLAGTALATRLWPAG